MSKRFFSPVVSFVLVICIFTNTLIGIGLLTFANSNYCEILADNTKQNWASVAGYTEIKDIQGGINASGTTQYGNGIMFNKEVEILSEIKFNLSFSANELKNGDWFALAFGNSGYNLDTANTSKTGVAFLMYKTAASAIQSATDVQNRWLDFPFLQTNSFKLVKSTVAWELYLKNSIITDYTLMGKIPFDVVSSDTFTENKCKFYFYANSSVPTNKVSVNITNFVFSSNSNLPQSILVNNNIASFSKTPDSSYTLTEIENGMNFKGNSTYGAGIVSANVLDVSKKVSFNLRFNSQIPVGGWFAIALHNDDYTFDAQNTSKKGVTFLIHQTAVNAVQSASDTQNRWLDFKNQQFNELTIVKGADAWELYLQNSIISDHEELIGKIAFTILPSTMFTNNKAHLSIYTYAVPVVNTDFDITYLNHFSSKTSETTSTIQEVSLSGTANNWTPYGDFAITDTVGGSHFSGKANFGYGATYKEKLDVSVGAKFDIKFSSQELTTGDSFVAITFGTDEDSFNNSAKGATFILYKQAVNAIQSEKDTAPVWRDFPFSSTNSFKFSKGIDSWDLYLMNSILTSYTLIGKIPFSSVPANIFVNDKANLGIYFNDTTNPNQTLSFDVSNLKHTIDTAPPVTEVQKYEDFTFVLPTEDSYWSCSSASSISNGVLSLGNNGFATYIGSRLTNRLAQFELSANIPTDMWVGFLARQSDPGKSPWDQSQTYFVLIKKDGTVDLMKKKGNSFTPKSTVTIASIIGTSGVINNETIRFGVFNEQNNVRIILDVKGERVIDFLDDNDPILEQGYTAFMSYNTATATVYLGPVGTDEDKFEMPTGYGKGKGYIGGVINPDYIFTFPVFSNYIAETISLPANTVSLESVSNILEMDELIIRAGQPGNTEVIVSLFNPTIIKKEVFEALRGIDKKLTFNIVDSSGKIKYSLSFNGSKIESEVSDIDIGLALNAPTDSKLKTLIKNADILMVDLNSPVKLPNSCDIHCYVGDKYDNGTSLRLYYYNKEDASINLFKKDITIDENGFITFTINDGFGYFLTNQTNDLSVASQNPNTNDNLKSALLLFTISFTLIILLVLNQLKIKRGV